MDKKIMFVCSGNTCRSPMAEGLFRKFLSDNGVAGITVTSAGTGAFPGDAVSEGSVLACEKRGVDIFAHRARRINPEDILTVDLFVCMSQSHAAALAGLCGAKRLLVLGVDDPYMQGAEVYESCCRQIERAFPGVLKAITQIPVIRPMTEADIAEIAELERECFSEPWSEKSLTEELTNDTARFFVLKSEDGVLGYIGANNIADEVYINNAAVGEKYRKNGFGQRLVHFLITHSALEGARLVTLEVRKSNENAVRLYEKCGFELAGERRDFYRAPKENALIYTLNLQK